MIGRARRRRRRRRRRRKTTTRTKKQWTKKAEGRKAEFLAAGETYKVIIMILMADSSQTRIWEG